MNVRFRGGFYSDVRIEEVSETSLQLTLGTWEQVLQRQYAAAFVRLFDGSRWYYASTTDLGAIQKEVDRLAAMAGPNPRIDSDPVVSLFETNTGDHRTFHGSADITRRTLAEKRELLASRAALVDGKPYVEVWRASYVDRRVEKTFFSSKGADLTFDTQRAGYRVGFSLAAGEKRLDERFDRAGDRFDVLTDGDDGEAPEHDANDRLDAAVAFLLDSSDMPAGVYPVVLSPEAAGVFAHESFGHKSEADFMMGDESMRKEWEIGKQVASPIVSIIEDGRMPGVGYVPFDDEGTKARRNYLIKDGILAGRLHSATTAASLGEGLTGNARAMDFEYEPIVRMTTTFIDRSNSSVEDLIAGVDDGLLVKTIKHGSGLSTFTIAPSLAYRIRGGKTAEPVKVSVVSGNVFRTLADIDALSDRVEIVSFALGGCGKMEQFPLPVGFGGPWVRVKALSVS